MSTANVFKPEKPMLTFLEFMISCPLHFIIRRVTTTCCLAALGIVLCLAGTAAALPEKQAAGALYKQGAAAEAREDPEAAYAFYHKALEADHGRRSFNISMSG